MFDKNIFLYLEEIDLCKRLKIANQKFLLANHQKFFIQQPNLLTLVLNMKNVEIGIGCGQKFISQKNSQINFLFTQNFYLYYLFNYLKF